MESYNQQCSVWEQTVQFKRIDRVSVSEEKTEYLKGQILSRELRAGAQWPSEELLAQNTAVGRDTVREALRLLRKS